LLKIEDGVADSQVLAAQTSHAVTMISSPKINASSDQPEMR
jgi:hypothetical protein